MIRMAKSLYVIAVFMLLGTAASCDRKEAEPVELVTLPHLKTTHDPELRAELSRLEAEQATPQLLDANRDRGGGSAKANAVRIVKELNEIYPLRDARLTGQRVARFYPQGEFRFGPIPLEKARDICKLCGPQLKQYRKMFRRKGFRCDVSVSDGLLADLSLLDHARLAHRLEALTAADVLTGGQPSAVLLPLRNMLRIDACLASITNVSARLAAARLRAEALEVVAALVKHPRCSRVICDELLRIFANQLDHWTADRVAWVGDRALGLHAYEMVRDGQLMNILTADEIAQLEKDGDLVAFDEAVRRSLDDDEKFYLANMRRLIAACDKPFFARRETFDELDQTLNQLRNTSHFPLFADKVLLPDVVAGQHEQALDRARCEAWALGLGAALGQKIDPTARNPVTGKLYDLARQEDAIVIGNLDGQDIKEPALTIPIPPR